MKYIDKNRKAYRKARHQRMLARHNPFREKKNDSCRSTKGVTDR